MSETPRPDQPAITVIVVSYNAGPHLAACLKSLHHQTFGDFEVIVCDNGSTDRAFAEAEAAAENPRLRFVGLGANLGFAAANNRAAAMARGDWLALLNPDAIAAPDWLQRLIEASRRHPDVDCFASLQIDAAKPERLDGAGDALGAWGIPWRGGHGRPAAAITEGECFSACAAAAFIRRSRFIALGGFAEAFFCFCEDVDLGFRHRLAGGRTVLVPAATVRHWGGASAGRRSSFALYHGTRNRLWAYLRCMPAALLWPTLPIHAGATVVLLLLAALRGEAGPVLHGLRDGLRALPAILAERRRIQAARRAGIRAIAGALTWSPRTAWRRDVAVRPIAAAGRPPAPAGRT